MSVLVVGSFVTDLMALCERAPEAGETVHGLSFNSFLGGKGANQAVACKRMGADVTMVGCVGNDIFGEDFVLFFQAEGFDTSYIKKSHEMKTGCSLVTLETSGQNRICMVSGANTDYSAEELRNVERLVASADVVVTQCEMRSEIVDELAALCAKYGKKFVLNPAPARTFSDETLKSVYLITPNETELGIIVGKTLENDEDFVSAGKELLAKGVKNVIVTLGSRGSLLVNSDVVKLVPSFKVKAVDTVGAGDSFTGSLSAFIDEGIDIIRAMTMSSAVGALSVQKRGAIPSMPQRSDVELFLKSHNAF